VARNSAARALRADVTQQLAQVEAEQAAAEAELRAVQDAAGAMEVRLVARESSLRSRSRL
jgi:hypothetical protein